MQLLFNKNMIGAQRSDLGPCIQTAPAYFSILLGNKFSLVLAALCFQGLGFFIGSVLHFLPLAL